MGNIDQCIQKVHDAAMKESLENVSDLVVDAAKQLVNADNGRLRFVDYTGKRLVPGSIRGALAENPELAVREIGECIVGHAVNDAIFENNVQENEYFIEFKETIKVKGIDDQYLKKYYDDVLEKLGSEIAVPVKAGQELIGVLSVNTLRKNAFNKEDDLNLLSAFASEIAIAFLNRRVKIYEKLLKIEEKMISLFNLEQVAQQIAEGIQEMVYGSIPNIFRYLGKEKNHLQFLVSAGASEEEKTLGKFLPRKDGRGFEAINKWKKGEDAFIVVENVQTDPRGSPTAKGNHIESTGCLPLVFSGTIVGVLYLHFKHKHFFTIEEKRILEMFAILAAIAIKNTTLLPTYIDKFGNDLLDELKNFEPSVREI